MKKLGLLLVFTSILLTFLFSVDFPRFADNAILECKSPITLLSGIHGFNVTLEPLNKANCSNYYVEVEAGNYYVNLPVDFDLWVVNETELGLLTSFMNIESFQEYYPDDYPFTLIKGHAKKTNITTPTRFRLENVNRNGKYCFLLANFYKDFTQNVKIKVTEHYEEPPKPVLAPNPMIIISAIMIGVTGLCLVVYPKVTEQRRRHVKKKKTQG
jgi:hypothetical protein